MPALPDDLFDIEKRPGAGVELWTYGIELELERVRDAGYRHRLHNSINEEEQRDDPLAEKQLHVDVYNLVLATRRVLRFHQLLAKQISDPRLETARAEFEGAAADIKALRDMFEHYDAYVLDDSKKHRKFEGRASPILYLRSDCDNVVVSFGDLAIDVTLAARAAIELGRVSAEVWNDAAERFKAENPSEWPEPGSVPRTFEVTMSLSTVVEYSDGSRRATGVLIAPRVRDATPEEIERYERPSND